MRCETKVVNDLMNADLPTKYILCSDLMRSNKLQIVSYAIGENLAEVINNYNAPSELFMFSKIVLASS